MKQGLLFFLMTLLISGCTGQSFFEPTQTATSLPSRTPTTTPTNTPVPTTSYFPPTTFMPNQTAIINGIEMRLERLDIVASNAHLADNRFLRVDTFLCFDKPNADENTEWSVEQSSKLEIEKESSITSSSSLLFDSISGYVGKEPLPSWLPKNEEKRCIKTSFQFDPSNKLVWRLAIGVPVTTDLTLTIPKLVESGNKSVFFVGSWIFHVKLNP